VIDEVGRRPRCCARPDNAQVDHRGDRHRGDRRQDSRAASRPRGVSKDDTEMLRNIDRDLKTVVFGQDRAIGQLASAIKLAPRRPALAGGSRIGSYLLAGPNRRRQDRGDAPARAPASASS